MSKTWSTDNPVAVEAGAMADGCPCCGRRPSLVLWKREIGTGHEFSRIAIKAAQRAGQSAREIVAADARLLQKFADAEMKI